MIKVKTRYEELDILKGFAMLLVYLGHSFIFGKTNIVNNTFLNSYIHATIYSFHMPLFFIISGFLANNGRSIDLKLFYRNKIKRLFIPYLFINLVDFIPRTLFPKLVNSKFLGLNGILLHGTKISWFIYTLFVLFLIFPILEKYILKKDKFYIFGIVLLLLNYFNLFRGIAIFSLNKVIYYLIFFYMGYMVKRNLKKISDYFVNNLFFGLIASVFLVLAYRYYNLNLLTLIIFAVLGSIFSLNLVIRLKKNKKIAEFFKFIGTNSLTFYLLEGFIAIIYRVILLKVIPVSANYTLLFSFFFLKVLTAYIGIRYFITKNSVLAFLLGTRKQGITNKEGKI